MSSAATVVSRKETWVFDEQRFQTVSRRIAIFTTFYLILYGLVGLLDPYSGVNTAIFGFAGLTTGLFFMAWMMRQSSFDLPRYHASLPAEKGGLDTQPQRPSASCNYVHYFLVAIVWFTVLLSLIILNPGLVPAIYGYFTVFFGLGIAAVWWKHKQTVALSAQEHLQLCRQSLISSHRVNVALAHVSPGTGESEADACLEKKEDTDVEPLPV